MKVLLINGGPHKKGCTNVALEEVKNILKKEKIESEIMWIGNNGVPGCIGCNYCLKNNNKCYIDDAVNCFLEKVKEYDGFVIGSPVHFAAASGNLTSFLDRAFYGRKELFEGKIYASVVSCRRGGASAAFDQLNKYALMSNMYIAGSSYWNQIHGTDEEEAKKDLEGLQTMRNLGKNIAFLLKSIEKAQIRRPILEKNIKTNFIQ